MVRRQGLPGAACAALAVALLGACTWVPLTSGGEGVRLVDDAATSGCEELGKTHARTTDHVWIFARSRDKVRKELASLARNEAAKMGGDTIAPRGPASEGEQDFGVYRCDAR